MLTVVSLFSGTGGFDLACVHLGLETLLACEIDPQARSVFRYHFPNTPIINDIKKIRSRDLAAIKPVDIICAGFPCQDLSVAGQRRGLAGQRSGLFHRIMRLITKFGAPGLRPRWIVLENVPGLLSSDEGRDMGTVLSEMEKRGYGWAYRVLDAQYFGVPQRRRRVFIVGCLGDWVGPAKVLFERESLFGNPPTRRKTGPGVAALTQSGVGTCGADDNQAQAGHIVPVGTVANRDVAYPLKASINKQDESHETFVAHTLRGPDTSNSAREGIGVGEDGDSAFTLQAGHSHAVAFTERGRASGRTLEVQDDISYCLTNPAAGDRTQERQILDTLMQVRRLMPIECERLMGLPDDWTRWGIDDRGEIVELADSPRYRMCGNGVERNNAQWIFNRIQMVDEGEL